MVYVCGTVSRFSYIQNIDVSFVLEKTPLETSSFHDVAGCVTFSPFVANRIVTEKHIKNLQ
jgi:hypothetical protein